MTDTAQNACSACVTKFRLKPIGMTGSWSPIVCEFCGERDASIIVEPRELVFVGGQSRSIGGQTFGTTIQGNKITSWRVDGAEVTEAEFDEALKEARTLQSRLAGQ